MKQIPSYLLHAIRPADARREKISNLLLLSPQECRSSLTMLSRLDLLADLHMEHVYALLPGGLSICSASFWWKHPEEENRHRRQDTLLLLRTNPTDEVEILAMAHEDGGAALVDSPHSSRRDVPDMRQALLALYDIAGEIYPGVAIKIDEAGTLERHRIHEFEAFLKRDDVVHAEWRYSRFATYGVQQVLFELEGLLTVARDPYSDTPLPYCLHHRRRAPVMSLRRTKAGGYALVDIDRQSKAWARSEIAAWRMLLRHLPRALEGEMTGHQQTSFLDKSRRHPVSKGLLTLSEAGGDPQPALFETICAE